MDRDDALTKAFNAYEDAVQTSSSIDKIRSAFLSSLYGDGFLIAPKEATAEMLAKACPLTDEAPSDDDLREASRAALMLNTTQEWWDRAVEQAALLRIDYRNLLSESRSEKARDGEREA